MKVHKSGLWSNWNCCKNGDGKVDHTIFSLVILQWFCGKHFKAMLGWIGMFLVVYVITRKICIIYHYHWLKALFYWSSYFFSLELFSEQRFLELQCISKIIWSGKLIPHSVVLILIRLYVPVIFFSSCSKLCLLPLNHLQCYYKNIRGMSGSLPKLKPQVNPLFFYCWMMFKGWRCACFFCCFLPCAYCFLWHY